MADVCLVVVPFHNIENPSLSLSLLKACLSRSNIESEIFYANMDFAKRVGLEAYYAIAWSGKYREALLGEYIFSKVAFSGFSLSDGYEAFLRESLQYEMGNAPVEKLLNFLEINKNAAQNFIDASAKEILKKKPRIVGCASSTQQNCAALALLRRIKELAPKVITVLGGPNCEDEMGLTLIESFMWLDFVIAGEADGFFADFCRNLLKPVGQYKNFPKGVLYRGIGSVHDLPHPLTECLDDMPFPDYDEYFTALQEYDMNKHVEVGLLIETSRGCWWGEKQPCIFCGMNGAVRRYRMKSPANVVAEFSYLRQRYKVDNFFAVDCILGLPHLAEVMPALAHQEPGLKLMYEVKSNLSYEQLRLLKQSGAAWLQPGIESLHDGLLELMHKGNRAICHVELLKNMAELRMHCHWIFLCDFPFEEASWYEKMDETIKLITHLQPPQAVFRVRYDRFNTYYSEMERFGLNLQPVKAYQYIYPLQWRDKLGRLAYFFHDAAKPSTLYADSFQQEHHRRISSRVKAWQTSYSGAGRDCLKAMPTKKGLEVVDLRKCARQRIYILSGAQAAIAIHCRKVHTKEGLQKSLSQAFSDEEILIAIEFLVWARLLVNINSSLLFLALFPSEEIWMQGNPVGKIIFTTPNK